MKRGIAILMIATVILILAIMLVGCNSNSTNPSTSVAASNQQLEIGRYNKAYIKMGNYLKEYDLLEYRVLDGGMMELKIDADYIDPQYIVVSGEYCILFKDKNPIDGFPG